MCTPLLSPIASKSGRKMLTGMGGLALASKLVGGKKKPDPQSSSMFPGG